MCFDSIETDINLAVPWFLMAAYAYYVEDDPILTDAQYDRLVKKMINNWDKIQHRHKALISLDELKAGSYLGKYPSIVEGAVKQMRKI
jgi:NAD-dependent DNA ligase